MYVFRLKIRRAANATGAQHVFLWGGKKVKVPLGKTCPLLSVRVDDDGERVKITALIDSQEVYLAELEPGEMYTVELANCTGVCAQSTNDTHVTCILHNPGP